MMGRIEGCEERSADGEQAPLRYPEIPQLRLRTDPFHLSEIGAVQHCLAGGDEPDQAWVCDEGLAIGRLTRQRELSCAQRHAGNSGHHFEKCRFMPQPLRHEAAYDVHHPRGERFRQREVPSELITAGNLDGERARSRPHDLDVTDQYPGQGAAEVAGTSLRRGCVLEERPGSFGVAAPYGGVGWADRGCRKAAQAQVVSAGERSTHDTVAAEAFLGAWRQAGGSLDLLNDVPRLCHEILPI